MLTTLKNKTALIKCKLFGCDWRYNFASMPTRCICYRCNKKQEFDYKSLTWNSVETFTFITDGAMNRTDEEIKKQWIK